MLRSGRFSDHDFSNRLFSLIVATPQEMKPHFISVQKSDGFHFSRTSGPISCHLRSGVACEQPLVEKSYFTVSSLRGEYSF